MKKLSIFAVSAFTLALCSCGQSMLSNGLSGLSGLTGSTTGTTSSALGTGSSILGSLLSNATQGNNLTNIITSVIGLDKTSQANLIGTWAYINPGCAFTSQSTLATAGGEVVAATVKNKLATYYSKIGFSSNNTAFAFAQNGTFQAVLLGKQVSGTYTFNESTQALTLNLSLLGMQAFTLNGYVKQNSNGIALLFESKKILSLLQSLGSLSGNSIVSSVTNVTKSYDGVRIGFDLQRIQ